MSALDFYDVFQSRKSLIIEKWQKYHREVAELAAVVTSSKVTDELGLSSDDPATTLTTRPTDVVWQNTSELHSELRQLRSAS